MFKNHDSIHYNSQVYVMTGNRTIIGLLEAGRICKQRPLIIGLLLQFECDIQHEMLRAPHDKNVFI